MRRALVGLLCLRGGVDAKVRRDFAEKHLTQDAVSIHDVLAQVRETRWV